jgi:hypothetical protein
MFDWLRRLNSTGAPAAEQARRLREAKRVHSPFRPTALAEVATANNPFQIDAGSSDGSAAHHSGASHRDAAPCCDAGAAHH